MEKHIDRTLEKYLISRFISMPKLFDELNIDYRVDGNMFCPFHENERTPSAHLYSDETGYRLWCFSEGAIYTSYDVYKVFYPQLDTNKLAEKILNRFPEEYQKKIINDLGAELEDDTIPYMDSLIKFKQHKINIEQLLEAISNTYIDE